MVCVTKLLCLYDKTDWLLQLQDLDGDERAKVDLLAAVKRIQMDYAY
jgi:hypothetical protein